MSFNITIDSNDNLKALKEEILENGKYPKKMKVAANTDDNKFILLMSYLRFVCFEGTEEQLNKVNSIIMCHR